MSWERWAELFGRTLHKGQLDIFGNEQPETVVRPKKKEAGKMGGQRATHVYIDEIADFEVEED